MPGEPRADPGPQGPRVDLPRARPAAGEGAPRAALRRAHLRRAVVQPAQAGPRRVHRREPAIRDRRGPPAPDAGLVRGHGPAQPAQPLRLRPGHLRRRGQLPPRGLGGLRAPLGPLGGDLGRHTGPPDARAPRLRPDVHPLARPLRGRPGGRAAGLHGEPAVRPAPVARRPRRLARRTCVASLAPAS